MSEVFEGYERQYCELSANLSSKCTAATAGGWRRLMIIPCRKNMGLQPSVKAAFLAKLREYKTDLNNLKTQVKRITSPVANFAARHALLEPGIADSLTTSNDQRGRLLMTTEVESVDGQNQGEEKSNAGNRGARGLNPPRFASATRLHGVDESFSKSKVLAAMTRSTEREQMDRRLHHRSLCRCNLVYPIS
ncbi:hypothetical protein ACFX13_039888 [Malus domestica]|uniref:Vesicle transport v-SNARE N-terminal domain-containing protein n=2 Tax=Malus domestica TaxID=3750 RepID=A0A498JMV1_MALDO|nr:hypothetical protein DVH24_008899 [Malus domestica]